MGVCQNIPTRFWASFFQNLQFFFHFSWHKIWLVRRAVTIFLLTQRSRLGGPFRYLEHVRKVHKKFSRGLWKLVSAQNMSKKWSSKSGWNILTKPHFWIWNFFQRPLDNLLLAWRTCSRYLKGPPNLALCVSKKIVTVRHNNQIILPI